MSLDPEYKKILIKGLIKLTIFLAIMFLAAGRLDYWQGWIFSGIILIHVIVAAVLFSDTPDLVRERLKPGPGMKWWDKIFWAFFATFSLATFLISPIDAGRLYWTKSLPGFVYLLAYRLLPGVF